MPGMVPFSVARNTYVLIKIKIRANLKRNENINGLFGEHL